MQVVEARLDRIDEGERARIEYGNIEELAQSIDENGVIQPISLSRNGDRYKLLAGGRRLRAAHVAGLSKIPAIVQDHTSNETAWEIELIENVCRKDFSWVERCQLEEKIYKLKEKVNRNWSQRKTANLLGRARSALSQDLELADAIRMVPELAEADTQNEAWKKWGHIKDDLAVKHVVKKQEEEAAKKPLREVVAPTERNRFKGFGEYIRSKYIIKDCFEGMADLNSSIIDFVEVDPPYAVDLAAHRQKAKDQHIVSTYNEIDGGKYVKFLSDLCLELYRVMKPHSWGILWYGSKWYPEIIDALSGAGFKYNATPSIWIKSGGGYTPNPSIHLANLYENFTVFRKGYPILCKPGRGNVFQYSQPSSKERIHPTERPLDMMQELLEVFTDESSIILVPFLGSGVTLRAAFETNRVAFGFDMDDVYRDRLLAGEEDG